MVDPRKFWTMCRIHDWFYSMSDDDEVYRNGVENETKLLRISQTDPKLSEIYEAWREYQFNSGPKPKEPSMED